jgi:hypothetical protein
MIVPDNLRKIAVSTEEQYAARLLARGPFQADESPRSNREFSRGIPTNPLADLLQLSVPIVSTIVHASRPLVPSLLRLFTAS